MFIKVVITGATGFVGSHILESVSQDKNFEVIAACRDRKELLPGFEGRVLEGDLRDQGYIDMLVKDADMICHAAAWSSLFGHQEKSDAYYLEPSLALIKAAKEARIRRFIFPSTLSAVAPTNHNNPMQEGIKRPFWPHLCNVVNIENELRKVADENFSTVVLRLGIFAGRRYRLGVLPILLPRLKTHLVPWIDHGKTHIPIIDGRDIAQAFHKTLLADLKGYEVFNITSEEQPTVREFITFIHQNFGYPTPHFSVPFWLAYPFAWLMEKLDPIVPWEPLVTRSIVHLLEETGADYTKARQVLGYQPRYHWKDAVKLQVEEIHKYQKKAMSMAVKE